MVNINMTQGQLDNVVTAINNRAKSTDVSSGLATKVDKVESTDNALVRFDGVNGAVQNSFVSISDTGDITTGGNINVSRGAFTSSNNTYDESALEIRGSGVDNLVKPSIGFHQPGLFGGVLKQDDGDAFGFYNLTNSGLIDVKCRTLFGNATSSNKTYSLDASLLTNLDNDNTRGKVVRVGDFGIGVAGYSMTFPTANGMDFNSCTVGGVYNIITGNYSGILNTPPSGNSYGTMVVEVGSDFITQKFTNYTNKPKTYTRSFYNGVGWLAWSESTIQENLTENSLPVNRDGALANSGVVVDSNGNLLSITPTGVIGYGIGAGGTVTQLTSKSAAVTLNKPNGIITMHNEPLASGATAIFVLSNSLITENDNVIVSVGGGLVGAPNSYHIRANTGYSGGFVEILVTNTYSTTLSENLKIKFLVIKGSVS
jgi:hypothetical protein